MSTDPAPVTIADAVHRAVRVLDPSGTHQNLGELLGRFEDDDQPIGVAAEAGQRIAEGVGARHGRRCQPSARRGSCARLNASSTSSSGIAPRSPAALGYRRHFSPKSLR